jgi:hypothetical protein
MPHPESTTPDEGHRILSAADIEFSELPQQRGGAAADLPEPMADGSDGALTDSQLADAHARRSILIACVGLLADGASLEVAARAADTNASSLHRILKLASNANDPKATQADKAWALIDGPIADLAPGRSTGAPSPWADILKVEAVANKLRELHLATLKASSEGMTHHRRTASVALTLERFAIEPECPPALAALLRRGKQPTPLKQFLGRVTPDIEAKVRGPKHALLHGAVSRRDNTIATADGRRATMRAGFIIEFDDMSLNQPFWCNGPDGEPMLSRQGLYARDVATGCFLAFDIVSRPREAYRAADILRFLRRLMMARGKPARLRLEKGIWKSRSIDGVTIKDDGKVETETWTRPDTDEAEVVKIQDGIRALGIELDYVTGPHRKGKIESGFRYLQQVTATFSRDFINIGSHAGEFERPAKALRRARAGSHHPADLGFASSAQIADCVEKAMEFVNARTVNRERSAADHWADDMRVRSLPALLDRDLPFFLPEIREGRVDGLKVTVKVNGQPHDYRHEAMANLGSGHRVFIRFDPEEPTLGAAIYNREGRTLANWQGHGAGDFLCFAPWEMPAPQCVLPGDIEGAVPVEEIYGEGVADIGDSVRRAQEKGIGAFVRTVSRVIGLPGQPSLRAVAARDGKGNALEATAPQMQQRSEAPAAPRRDSGQPTPRAQREQISRNSAVVDPRLREFYEEEPA